MRAEAKWNASFGDIENSLDSRLAEIFGEKWDGLRTKLINEFAPKISEQNRLASLEYASNYFDEIQKRTEGQMESPIREMLLAFHPKYKVAPDQEFAS